MAVIIYKGTAIVTKCQSYKDVKTKQHAMKIAERERVLERRMRKVVDS